MTRKPKRGKKVHPNNLGLHESRKGRQRLLRDFSFWADQSVLDDKLIGINYFNVQNPTAGVTLAYNDPLARLTSISDGTGTSTYNYYPFGQTGGEKLQSVSQPIGTTTANIAYGYDSDGRITSKTIDGVGETYGFTNNQLTSVTNPLGSFVYQYDSASARLTQVNYPNGQQSNFDYFTPADPLGSGNLKVITNLGTGSTNGQTLSKFSYQYNQAGEITNWVKQLDNTSSNALTLAIGYDQASQLQAVTQTANNVPSQSSTFVYDSSGNRTLEQTSSFTHTFGTNNLNQLTNITQNPIHLKGGTDRPSTITVNGASVTEDSSNNFETDLIPVLGTSTPITIRSIDKVDGVVTTKKNHVLNTQPFAYDANGNLIQDNEKNYSWDACNRLVGISYLSPKPIGVIDNVSFQYDGAGRRTAITEKHGSTVITDKRFVWVGEQLCQERNSTGNTVSKQFFDEGEQIGGTNYYCTFDHLGSMREMVDGNGNIHARYDFDAWGRQTKLSGDQESDFGYTGFYVEHAVNLCLTWFRSYDAGLGRWLSPDPLGEDIGFGLYVGMDNSPIVFIDPYGLKTCKGKARVLKGNKKHIGKKGGFGVVISSDSAVIIPDQWGSKGVIRPNINSISGTCSSSGCSFKGVADVVGGKSPDPKQNARQYFQSQGLLVIELPGADIDNGMQDITFTVPDGQPCPYGTKEGK